MRRYLPLLVVAAFSLTMPSRCAASLNEATIRAFDDYVAGAEQHLRGELNSKNYLDFDSLPEQQRSKLYDELRQGGILITNQLSGKDAAVPGGLLHDWIAVVFIPGATIRSTLAVLQDYDRDDVYYRPDVVKSKLLSRSGDDFRVFLRLKRTYVITAVFDTEYDVRYTVLNPTHAYSRSVSTRIAEVEDAGKPTEHDDSPGEDRGLLWRLNSYWKFYEADGGTYVQCEAISLTRDIPTGLGWLVKTFVEKVPMESLRFTLAATRQAVQQHTSKGD